MKRLVLIIHLFICNHVIVFSGCKNFWLCLFSDLNAKSTIRFYILVVKILFKGMLKYSTLYTVEMIHTIKLYDTTVFCRELIKMAICLVLQNISFMLRWHLKPQTCHSTNWQSLHYLSSAAQ